MIATFIVMSVVSLGLLIYGVLTHKKRVDAGDKLMIEGLKIDADNWVPLMLMPSTLVNSDQELIRMLRMAIKFWNDSTGLTLFKGLGELNLRGRTVAVMADSEKYIGDEETTKHNNAIAYVTFCRDQYGMVRDAVVYLVNMPDRVMMLERALAHELGHLLGLDHDESKLSVMYPQLDPSVFCVTEKDKAFLRKTYGS